jgi:hypothetical protein
MGDFVILEFEERMGSIEESVVGLENFRIGSDEDGSSDRLKICEESICIEGECIRLRSVSCSKLNFYKKAEDPHKKNSYENIQLFLHDYLTN